MDRSVLCNGQRTMGPVDFVTVRKKTGRKQAPARESSFIIYQPVGGFSKTQDPAGPDLIRGRSG